MGSQFRVERRQDGQKMLCKVGGRSEGGREADGRARDGVRLDSSEAAGATGGETETERGTGGERFSINKTAGQIWLVSGNIFIRCPRPALSSF